MFGLFKRKVKEPTVTFAVTAVDMHSHILPGIDDGAATVEDSIVLIKAMMEIGIKKIIATPHIMYEYHRNTPETVNNALSILKAELVKQQIDIEVQAAAEYFFDEHFVENFEKRDILTLGGKYVLIEFGFISAPPVFIPVIQQLKDAGYQPILAHPERYSYLTMDELRNIRDWGCLLQVNTISLTGYYGRETKKIAEELIDNNMVDFIGSDMHHPRHAAALKDALNFPYVKKLLSNPDIMNTLLL